MIDIWTYWWAWLGAALALAILETLVPGFIFLGIAAGAATTAVIAAPAAIFALLSLISWAVMRKLFKARNDQARFFDEDINN